MAAALSVCCFLKIAVLPLKLLCGMTAGHKSAGKGPGQIIDDLDLDAALVDEPAGGDAVTGAATLMKAVAAGKDAAAAIFARLAD